MSFNFAIDVNQSTEDLVDYVPVQKAKAPTRSFGRTRGDGGKSFFDGFRRRLIPSDTSLVQEYKRTIYACANLNAQACILNPLKLYLKTGPTDSPTILRRGIETKALSTHHIDRLTSQSFLQKTLRSFVDIEEVVSHPALTLLETANDSQFLNGFKLQELLYLYMDITGTSYWLVENNVLGIPGRLWILPSQNMTPIKTPSSRKIVDKYRYQSGNDASSFIDYSPRDIIPFTMADLNHPYVEGLSFVEAAYEANKAHNQLLTLEASLLENEARPEMVMIPDDDSGFGPEEAEAIENKWRSRFGRGRQGGMMVLPEKVKLEPVQVPFRDLARLEINKWTKNDIANASQVPFALIADASHNRQQLEAAEIQHAKHAVMPRNRRVACVLNDQYLSRFDNTGRLFFAYDDPVPEMRLEKLQENVQLVMNGIKTGNEARKEYNLPPLPGGDELVRVNDPKEARQSERDSGSAEQ